MSKRRTITLLALAELFGIGLWFSASAVVPALTREWGLDDDGRAWLTMSVQLGFVVGALLSAIFNLADLIPTHTLFAFSACAAAIANLGIALLPDARWLAPALRFLTGVCLAGVYPTGMKIMTTWTKQDRGFGVGLLIGALTVGSASPHLISAFGGVQDWRVVLIVSSALALVGALIARFAISEGPYASASPKFNMRYVIDAWRSPGVRLANFGYFGHMWELYAMWTWIPLFLLASFQAGGLTEAAPLASVAAFAVIAAGGIGSVLAGKFADRIGRTTITSIAMIVSGTCALLIGLLFGASPWLVVLMALVWGIAVVADSAQFSASISELCDPQYIGTTLSIQTSLGFLLTLVTIRLLPTIEAAVTWRYAFAFLAIGPALGTLAMLRLRRRPEALQLAGGNR